MTITPEQKQAVDSAGNQPVRLEDPESHRAFVLISAEQFDRMNALLSEDPVEQMYPFLDEAFRDGWDDPAMDVYDDLDPRKP